MLRGRDQRQGVGQVVPLKAAGPRPGKEAVEEHILARSFDHASPPLVPPDIDHRRIGLVNARGAALGRRGPCRAFGKRGIPARRLGQRRGKDRLQPVDDVGREEQRDAEPALLQRQPLGKARALGADAVEERPKAPGPDLRGRPLLVAVEIAGIDAAGPPAEGVVEDGELSCLLLRRHPGDQVGNARFCRRGALRGGKGAGREREGERHGGGLS